MSDQKQTLSVKQLKRQGYCRTSNKHRMASRIDREDWKEYCLEKNHPVDADFYRRVLSKDNITVPQSVFKGLLSSNASGAPKEWRPKLETEIQN